ncbi:MAG: hypothetical protein ONB48_19925 [candidate division KSB1 bacterium]|nr:hypothetical protein [candidate division KSB1 bacterium]MDZ7276278.1 hypothetical protein [candidate division KSB1 bacterium]MDZ7287916.1 hypothetical protein [candidate division KSB1 bacterium]MDZ7300071.1 hypothetical protein [candidate division KSB1 bacterium]MDZ7351073.1 hypothetical protein [candidate division KSB1 bacterium]
MGTARNFRKKRFIWCDEAISAVSQKEKQTAAATHLPGGDFHSGNFCLFVGAVFRHIASTFLVWSAGTGCVWLTQNNINTLRSQKVFIFEIAPFGKEFVAALWAPPIPRGPGRYYDGLLSLLAMLQLSGNFRIYDPTSDRPGHSSLFE